MDIMNEDLRKKLSDIVCQKNADNWSRADLFIKNILPILPKELKIIELPPSEDKQYNCFVYALGLSQNECFLRWENVWVFSNDFLNSLIASKYLIETKEIKTGNIILYRDDKSFITHAGIMKSKNIEISKFVPIMITSKYVGLRQFARECVGLLVSGVDLQVYDCAGKRVAQSGSDGLTTSPLPVSGIRHDLNTTAIQINKLHKQFQA